MFALISKLPLTLQAWIGILCPPPWLLPDKIVLKTRKKGWDEEFETEKQMYARMRALQGHGIPILYGEAAHEGDPALVLSDVGGVPLYHDACLELDVYDVTKLLEDALRPIIAFGVEYADAKLDNFRLVGDRIVVLDFEQVYELRPYYCEERALIDAVDQVVKYWRVEQKEYRQATASERIMD